MTATCEIVTIKTKNGPVDINKSDFDAKTMTIYKEPPKVPKKGKANDTL